MKTVEQMIEAIEYRIGMLEESLDVLTKHPEHFNSTVIDQSARVDELEGLLGYMKEKAS